MKILVTGGAGFIGSHVVDALIEAGHQVVVVDDLSTGHEANLNSKAVFYRMDIRAPSLVRVFEVERPELVNHHAAQMSVRVSVREPLMDSEVNIQGTLYLLENCRRYGVRKIVYISSGGAVYGEPRYLPCDEDHPINPTSPYGISKHTPEHYLSLYRDLYGLGYTVLRYPNIYGPRQDPEGEAGVVAIFALHMLRGEPVTIYGSGEQERDFVYISDVVEANLLALDRGDAQVFNLGWGVGTSVNQIFHHLKKIIGYPKEPIYTLAKAGETFRIYLDATRAQRELGWRPTVGLEEGLRRTVDYLRTRVLPGGG